MRARLALLLAAFSGFPAAAQDSNVAMDQVSQRLLTRSGGQISDIAQSGEGNHAETLQSGGRNRAAILQSGTGNSASIRQSGMGLEAEARQSGGASLSITQAGHVGRVQVQQFTPGGTHAR